MKRKSWKWKLLGAVKASFPGLQLLPHNLVASANISDDKGMSKLNFHWWLYCIIVTAFENKYLNIPLNWRWCYRQCLTWNSLWLREMGERFFFLDCASFLDLGSISACVGHWLVVSCVEQSVLWESYTQCPHYTASWWMARPLLLLVLVGFFICCLSVMAQGLRSPHLMPGGTTFQVLVGLGTPWTIQIKRLWSHIKFKTKLTRS